MVQRVLSDRLKASAHKYPIVVLTGPRQAGKTTLCRACFPQLPCVSLELPDVRQRVIEDARGFMQEHAAGAILDEVQHVPELLSYLQFHVDAHPEPGRFVLTGSQHFGLRQAVEQSLAGRAALLDLLPFSRAELREGNWARADLFETLWTGGYPPILDRGLEAGEWLANHVATYVERDARQILNISDLRAFQTFLRLCAGRTGQMLNLSALGADAGITHNTARSWLGVLEASYICFRLPPYFRNAGKRLLKTPKLHFHDSGLACYLLGIRSPNELRHHPLRGAIFESWVLSEIIKARVNAGISPDLTYFRDRYGLEVDAIVQAGPLAIAIEAKSGATVAADAFAGLDAVAPVLGRGQVPLAVEKIVVHGGSERWQRQDALALPWGEIDQHDFVRR